MNQFRCLVFFLAFALVTGGLVGCSTKPTYIQPGFDPSSMDGIIVLPAIDRRADPDPDQDFEAIRATASSQLLYGLQYQKQYRAETSSNLGQNASYTAAMLPVVEPGESKNDPPKVSVDPAWVKRLGPAKSRWVAVPTIDAMSDWNVGLAVGFSATMSLYIFDKQSGELVWYAKSTGAVRGAGLANSLAFAIMGLDVRTQESIRIATVKMMEAFEKKAPPYLLP